MRCTILVLSLAIIYATGSPIADEIIPEDSLYAQDDDLLEARQTIDEMTAAGKSDKDCRKLVTETRKEVQTNVDTCQKTVNALPNGAHCMNLGQGAVKTATELKSKADKHVVHCHNEVTKAASHKVNFGSRTFSSLTEGKCDSFYSSSAYTTATATHTKAVTAHNKAKGAAKEAAVGLKNALAAAAKAKHECLCKTRVDHAKAFATHSAADAANQKAWSFACKVECVLDGKTKCTCSASPKCKRAKLTDAVKNEAGKCDAVAAAKKKAAEEAAAKKRAEEAKKAAAAAAAKAQREAAERHQKSFSCKCKMVDYRGACRGYRADAEPNFCPGHGQGNCASRRNGFGQYPCMWSNRSPGRFRL